ncbi:MAG: DegQ family serine endoprotease [Gammaproteobacteria bacterium]
MLIVMLTVVARSVYGFGGELPDFTELAAENRASVVNIGTTFKRGGKKDRLPKEFKIPDLPEGSPFNDFFRRFFEEEGPQGFTPQTSLGSGFVISKDGYVISNYHVVKEADEILVRLSDRREYVAKAIGTDERSDLAVLKIDANDLPVAKIGRSANVKVGEWVLAIGSPFGFDYSVTAGIVSAIGRNLPNENYVPFIQTDVAINPGNSGGPLFNLDGEVIGVNSQIYSRTGGFMGLSFAIPIDVVMNVYQQLRDKGSVIRGWLGVLIQDVTKELAESFRMDKPRGALVAEVLPNSPASKAGFKTGDVVIEFDGDPIDLSSDLPPMVGSTAVDKKTPVKIIREGTTQTLEVIIGELPPEEEIELSTTEKPGKPGTTREKRLKLVLEDLAKEQREKLKLGDHGVLVQEVEEGPAQKAGVLEGDVILQIDSKKVKDSKHLKELVAQLPEGKAVPMLIQRKGGPIFLALKISE